MKFKDKFGDYTGKTWEGNLSCIELDLTSLEGAPKIVNGNFFCFINNLTSLKYAPEIVEGSFYCSYNNLTSLEGAPKIVKGIFNCYNNPKLYELTENKLKKIIKAELYIFDYVPIPLTMYLKRLREKYKGE